MKYCRFRLKNSSVGIVCCMYMIIFAVDSVGIQCEFIWINLKSISDMTWNGQQFMYGKYVVGIYLCLINFLNKNCNRNFYIFDLWIWTYKIDIWLFLHEVTLIYIIAIFDWQRWNKQPIFSTRIILCDIINICPFLELWA